jgi:hypothetical protein
MTGRVDLEWPRPRKEEVVVEIADMVGSPAPPMSVGSKEPRRIFELVNDRLSLGLDPSLDKPGLARGIVEASGHTWHPDFESRGATITLNGLLAVRDAVRFFVQ